MTPSRLQWASITSMSDSKAAKAAALAAALKKSASDPYDQPRPDLAPIAPSAADRDRDALRLRKSNLLGLASLDAVGAKLEANGAREFEAMAATVTKMLNNVLAQPAEPKYRKLRPSNPTLAAKVFACKGAPELFELVGFRAPPEPTAPDEVGFLVLPQAADLAMLRKALELLEAHTAQRAANAEKKRSIEQVNARKAREERMQKARDEAASAAFEAAAAAGGGSSGGASALADEEEAMVDVIAAWLAAHPEQAAGRSYDHIEIEARVPGPGGSLVASIVASAGTQYYDGAAYLKREADGAWTVSKVEIA
jgi:hypothetical protein